MTRGTLAPLLLTLVMGGLWAGCDSRSGLPLPNAEPNTRISAGPPEAADTSFNINLFWFGWDDDGFIDFYEIAWELPYCFSAGLLALGPGQAVPRPR